MQLEKKYIENGWYIWVPDFLNGPYAHKLYNDLLNNYNWQGGTIKLFGKVYEIPRKQLYFADDGKSYGYSGHKLAISPWTEELSLLKQKVSEVGGHHFNVCLANLYRDGNDSNGWHADNEKELGKNPVIASISLGVTRRFDLKHIKTNERFSFKLNHGSLLIMGGEMQHYWKHQVPKERKIKDSRVNLTFRYIP